MVSEQTAPQTGQRPLVKTLRGLEAELEQRCRLLLFQQQKLLSLSFPVTQTNFLWG
jgi:hypothetical protein